MEGNCEREGKIKNSMRKVKNENQRKRTESKSKTKGH